MKITWNDIERFKGLYQVNNIGEIRSIDRYLITKNHRKMFLKGKKLKQSLDRYGYKYVILNKSNRGFYRRTHRLVAEAFLSKPSVLHIEVNHIDGDKSNNQLKNLEWVTRIENIQHSIKIGIRKPHLYNIGKLSCSK